MATPHRWKILRLPNDEFPVLLVRAELDSAGYSIHLTDLSCIWGEQLTRHEIGQRARECGSSIDPGQGDDQLKILLEHIEGALNGRDGTSLDLAPHPEDPSNLVIRLTAALPGTLPPLEWHVRLQSSPTQNVGAALVMPLLRQANTLRIQVQQLIAELQNKDRVISKITDRLEISGNDLTTVYPNVSRIKTSRKRSQREQLGPHIAGLSEFDEGAWAVRSSKFDETSLSPETMDSIFAALPDPKTSPTGRAITGAGRHSLSKTDNSIGVPMGHSGSRDQANGDGAALDVVPDRADLRDSDFQRQSTPLRLTQEPTNNAQISPAEPEPPAVTQSEVVGLDEESTEDESDLDAAPRRNVPRKLDPPTTSRATESGSASPLPVQAQSKLESFDEPLLTSDAKEDSHPSSQMRKPRSKLGVLGGNSEVLVVTPEENPTTVSNSQDERSISALHGTSGGRDTREVRSATSTTKPRSKLGTFGGKLKSSVSAQDSNQNASEPQAELATPSSPVKHKLGMVGGRPAEKAGDYQSTKVKAHSPVGVLQRTKASTPVPEETEEDRANQKRLQLKRELEEKAKAPVKKKRKF